MGVLSQLLASGVSTYLADWSGDATLDCHSLPLPPLPLSLSHPPPSLPLSLPPLPLSPSHPSSPLPPSLLSPPSLSPLPSLPLSSPTPPSPSPTISPTDTINSQLAELHFNSSTDPVGPGRGSEPGPKTVLYPFVQNNLGTGTFRYLPLPLLPLPLLPPPCISACCNLPVWLCRTW